MRALVENDRQAWREFHATVGSAMGDFRGWEDETSPLAKGFPDAALEWLADDAGAGDATRAQQTWITAVTRSSHCRALSSDTWHRPSDGYRVATVRFTCQVGDIERLRPLFEASLFDDQNDRNAPLWSSYVTLLRDGPFRSLYGTTQLVMDPDSEILHSEGLDQLSIHGRMEKDFSRVLMEAWMPMLHWWSQTHRAREEHMTLVADCYGMIQQYQRCAARFAPNELLGAHELARHISAQHKTLADSKLTQQCLAMRPKIDALRPEPCD
ncbi:hypothetical protein [Stenotrophomonas forensis]